MRLSFSFLILCLLPLGVMARDFQEYLFPVPKSIKLDSVASGLSYEAEFEEKFNNTFDKVLSLDEGNAKEKASHRFGKRKELTVWMDTTNLKPQGYCLNIDENGIQLQGHDQSAIFYGKQTLWQLLDFVISEKKELPNVYIEDWPDFERRGYMLDISRDKVPTLQTLYQQIDLLAKWKVNELQLYTEHTFAYQNHKEVWENASPLTPAEISLLQTYCNERFIDLVPNQNSFGHMENWLKHDEYLDLAECPNNCKTKWGTRKRHSLDPTNPKSFELMQELYRELLPNFNSPYFNIGCDETIELCNGRSKEECDRIGQGKVYLDYLKKLNDEVNSQGKTSQFWGDIILNHPELIPSLPKNMIALVWGYDDTYPFDVNLPEFKNAGMKFYVCPGTSSWRSLIGRNHNAFINMKNGAIEGKKNGAMGYLNTNWGDHGHWQPLSVCYPTMMLGTGYAWNVDSTSTDELEFQLNHYIFQDSTGNTAKALLMLGDAYRPMGLPEGNANGMFLMLRRYKWTMKGNWQTKHLTISGLEKSRKEINEALEVLKQARPQCADSAIIIAELEQASALALHGIDLGIARLKAPGYDTKNIPVAKQQELYNELKPLIDRHRELWVKRNQPGGLDDSAGKLEELLNYYKH